MPGANADHAPEADVAPPAHGMQVGRALCVAVAKLSDRSRPRSAARNMLGPTLMKKRWFVSARTFPKLPSRIHA